MSVPRMLITEIRSHSILLRSGAFHARAHLLEQCGGRRGKPSGGRRCLARARACKGVERLVA